jgi:hypothetical protein
MLRRVPASSPFSPLNSQRYGRSGFRPSSAALVCFLILHAIRASAIGYRGTLADDWPPGPVSGMRERMLPFG